MSPHWNPIWRMKGADTFNYIAVTRLVLCLELQEVSLHRFSGSRSQMKQCSKMTVYYLILSRPTPVAMITKFVTKSAITRLVYEISPRSLRLATSFRDPAIEFQTNSTTTDPRCHSNKIWDKIGYNIACVGDICEILSSNKVIGVQSNSTTTRHADTFDLTIAVTRLVPYRVTGPRNQMKQFSKMTVYYFMVKSNMADERGWHI